MSHINWGRFAITGFVGSIILIVFLKINDVRDYAVAISWSGFMISNYFFHRLEMAIIKTGMVHMIDADIIKKKLSALEREKDEAA